VVERRRPRSSSTSLWRCSWSNGGEALHRRPTGGSPGRAEARRRRSSWSIGRGEEGVGAPDRVEEAELLLCDPPAELLVERIRRRGGGAPSRADSEIRRRRTVAGGGVRRGMAADARRRPAMAGDRRDFDFTCIGTRLEKNLKRKGFFCKDVNEHAARHPFRAGGSSKNNRHDATNKAPRHRNTSLRLRSHASQDYAGNQTKCII
jgi:hypothetical protein